jgi:hypothetical protein
MIAHESTTVAAPNPPLQLTPLRVDKIGAILHATIRYDVVSIYWCGAAEWHAVELSAARRYRFPALSTGPPCHCSVLVSRFLLSTPLRQRMREDMQLRGLAARTQEAYLAAVCQLAVHYDQSPDQLTEEQLRQ